MPQASRAKTFATPADRAACRQAIRQGSRSFHMAGQFLPAAVREPAFAVYAFCRMADDLIDQDGGGLRAIGEVQACLDRVYAGRPRPHYIERAFADAVARFAIPRAVPDALVEGLRWDAEGRQYDTLSDLVAYAVRVAGSVGIMMSLIMQRRDPAILARACDLGIAMQLTNICRDVGEDARNGRLYLPQQMLRRVGLASCDVLDSTHCFAPLRGVVELLLVEAERHYDRAAAGIVELPSGSRTGIAAARLLYREIGRMVWAGVDPVAERAVVSRNGKIALLARSLRPLPRDVEVLRLPPAPQAAWLLDAVAGTPAATFAELPRWWDLPGRTVRMVELLAGFEGSGARRLSPAGSLKSPPR